MHVIRPPAFGLCLSLIVCRVVDPDRGLGQWSRVALDVAEYVENLRQLLHLDCQRWRLVVERQVLSQVVPKLKGTRADLEPHLWSLLVLCLNGHEASTPILVEQTWAQAEQAALNGRSLGDDGPAQFPRAAIGVANVIATLRDAGVFPPPMR